MSNRVLIVLHQETSSPGRVGQALIRRGFDLDIRRPRFGDPLPETLARHAGAVQCLASNASAGGKMLSEPLERYFEAAERGACPAPAGFGTCLLLVNDFASEWQGEGIREIAPVIRFRPIYLSTDDGGEDARLVLLNNLLVAILVKLSDGRSPDRPSWYLETSFPPYRHEGIIFPTLDAAADWLQANAPERVRPDRARAA